VLFCHADSGPVHMYGKEDIPLDCLIYVFMEKNLLCGVIACNRGKFKLNENLIYPFGEPSPVPCCYNHDDSQISLEAHLGFSGETPVFHIPEQHLEVKPSKAREFGITLMDPELEKYQNANSLQKYGAGISQKTIYLASKEKKLAPLHHKGKVLDFGCGVGGSTYFLHQNGAEVAGVDLSDSIQELKRLNILPLEKIVQGNGLKLMEDTPDNTYDMITCFMLGSDSDGEFIDKFYREANRIIKKQGRILVTSDGATLKLLLQKHRGNYGSNIHKENIFIGRKNPELIK